MVLKRTLGFLICPISGKSLTWMPKSKLLKLNLLIEKGKCYTDDNEQITFKIEKVLWQKQEKNIYLVKNEVPILLEKKVIHIKEL